MLSLRRGPLARRLRVLTSLAREKVRYRDRVRERATALAAIRAALDMAGLDATDNPRLRCFDGADRQLARLHDSEAARRAEAVFIAADPKLADDPQFAEERRLAGPAPAPGPRFVRAAPAAA